MNTDLLLENITNPALLFFFLGIFAVYVKSDLRIPPNSSKFISLYLLFAIGFKGGQELAHSDFTMEVALSILLGIALSFLIPVFYFFILKRKLSVYDAGAVAAAYGSVSAVTFVTAVSYLEAHQLEVRGHMVAIMALMESPAIIAGLLLISFYTRNESHQIQKKEAIRHSVTNASVLLIVGSLLVGFLADEKQAKDIEPFTTDIFKGFLALFLLDMGISSGRQLNAFLAKGWFPVAFAMLVPLINGTLATLVSSLVTDSVSDRFMFGILAASASYIAVPASMKIAVPQANPGIFLPMALAITFPVNITLGMPIYYWLAGI
jgi:uncharacterized protein